MKLTFLGGTGTVTGSKYLLEADGRRVLIDCGLFQGYKQLRLRNWAPLPVAADSIDAVIVTHAHLDHSGYLPRLTAQGFRGPIYSTPATLALCKLLLPDSAHLQEEDARFANQRGFSKHSPALPLYTQADAAAALKRFETVAFGETFEPVPNLRLSFRRVSHLLGAAFVVVEHAGKRVVFSGDVGRDDDVLMRAPEIPPACDYMIIESTYGDRVRPKIDPETELAAALQGVIKRGGVAVMPTFAVGRAQALLVCLARLKRRGVLDGIPVYVDSPMATDASYIYNAYQGEHRLTSEECREVGSIARFVATPDESRHLDTQHGPMIILSASGMATGGRVVHHLKAFASDPRNLILLGGFQAGGTRGAQIAAGARYVRIHGQEIPVRAEVQSLHSFSGHADADQLIAWARAINAVPDCVYVTHGEPNASDILRRRIETELKWRAVVPEYRDTVEL